MLALCMVFCAGGLRRTRKRTERRPRERSARGSEAPALRLPAETADAEGGLTIVDGKLTMSTNAQFPPMR